MDPLDRLRRNARLLREQVDEQLRLLECEGPHPTSRSNSRCSDPRCPHRRKLRETLVETVTALEETRKSFKSKQIETLRRKLLDVLARRA